MRIIFLIPLLSTVGGQERTMIDKANFLADHGHEVMFITYEHDGPIAYPMSSYVKHLDFGCHFFELYKYPIYFRFWKALKLKWIFRKKMSELISFFCPDIINVAIPNTENFICDVMSVAKEVPVVVESHLAQGYQVIKRGVTEKWLYLFFNPISAVRHASLLFTLTDGDAGCWRKTGVKHVKVIPNPVTSYPDQLPIAEKQDKLIICVGRFTRQKRFDRVIDAFSMIATRYADWNVVIFGEGEEKEMLQKQIVEKNLNNRILLMPPTEDIYFYYKKSRFLILSSDFEGFGLVIVEAMSCGIPVVATDCPFGPSEIIEDGMTGLLTKMDVNDLTEKMEWMINHDEEREQMGRNAYFAAGRYRKELIMPQWEKAYLSVIKS